MKKTVLFLTSLMFLATFTSCFKDKDGEYKPKEKISRIYKDYGDGDGKELKEVWNWDKKKLERIDHYSSGSLSWSEEFTYNKKGQIERIDCYEGSEYAEYKYDGRKLSKITYYDNGSIEEEYSFKHDGNKISEIEIMYFYRGKSESRLMTEGYNPIKMLLSERNYQAVRKTLNDNATRENITAKLEWEKKNVSRIELNAGSERLIMELIYDDKLNPFKNYNDLYTYYDEDWEDLCFVFSKNNITENRMTYTDDGETETDIQKYSYSYDGKFPTVQRYTYSYESPIFDDWYDIIGYETVTRNISTYYEYE